MNETYGNKTDELISKYTSLVEYVQSISFPPLRTGVIAPPDQTGWSRLRRWAFLVSSPFLSTSTTENGVVLVILFAFWQFATSVWILIGNAFFSIAFEGKRPETEAISSSLEYFFLSIILVAIVILSLMAYWRWVEFLRDLRYPRPYRRLIVSIFILIFLSMPFWYLDPSYRINFQEKLFINPNNLLYVTIAVFLCVFPAFTFIFSFLLDSFIWGLQFFITAIEYFYFAHLPFPIKTIRRIIQQPISTESPSQNWHLKDLEGKQLTTIRNWAQENREGSEKRILPMTVIAALFGLLGAGEKLLLFLEGLGASFKNIFLDNIAGFDVLYKLTSEIVLPPWMINLIGINLLFLVIFPFLDIARNLVVQSLIIEACIVAEYGKTTPENEIEERPNFWRMVRDFFAFPDNKK